MENMYTLITGASSGIGRAFALEYGRRGQNLIITARSCDKLQELKREIEKDNQVSIECIIMDLAAEGSAKLLYEEIRERKLHVDVLINNAGFATKGLFHKTDYKRQHEEMLLNIVSLTELTYLLLEDMCQKDMEPSLTLHRQPPSTRFRIRQFMQPRRLMCFFLHRP